MDEAGKHIIKRRGHTEPYDPRKLYASVYASCLSVQSTTGEAELIAERVVADVEHWLKPKHEVTRYDMRHRTAEFLSHYNPDAGYIYLKHSELHK